MNIKQWQWPLGFKQHTVMELLTHSISDSNVLPICHTVLLIQIHKIAHDFLSVVMLIFQVFQVLC